MNIEEIINAAVEKRVSDIIEAGLSRTGENNRWQRSDLEQAIADRIQQIAQDEVAKHDARIRLAAITALETSNAQFEIKVYSNVTIPKFEP